MSPWFILELGYNGGVAPGGEPAEIAGSMSPLGGDADLAISVRGPAAPARIVLLKATRGRVPMTDIWLREPRRFWHRPMARSIRYLSLSELEKKYCCESHRTAMLVAVRVALLLRTPAWVQTWVRYGSNKRFDRSISAL